MRQRTWMRSREAAEASSTNAWSTGSSLASSTANAGGGIQARPSKTSAHKSLSMRSASTTGLGIAAGRTHPRQHADTGHQPLADQDLADVLGAVPIGTRAMA